MDPKEINKYLAIVKRNALDIIDAAQSHGPVDLQQVWLRTAQTSLRAGTNVNGACLDADFVVHEFVKRAKRLAEDTATLPYVGPAHEEDAPPSVKA